MAHEQVNGEEALHRLRHSTAHVMAEAVLSIFPEGKLAFGPPIEKGFYYDFDLPRALTTEDLAEVEKRMRAIIRSNYAFVRRDVSVAEARGLFAGQPYKLDQIEKLSSGAEDEHGEAGAEPVSSLSIYTHHEFTDLCRGPHLERTGQIPADAFKLLNVAGAYWRGDEKQPMLQRIYGTVWAKREELEVYLAWLAEVDKRDHRRLGKELDLFSFHEEAGAGLVYWHPKGARIRTLIEDFWRERHRQGGYEVVYSPHIGRARLWETSGHLGFYKDAMYSPMDIDGQDYYLKPMNCPFHIMMYQAKRRSYRELPMRWAELGTVYRYERSGVLHGLMRVRGFTQDDAHIFCTPEQIEGEILEVLRFSLRMLEAFGFQEFKAYLATRPADAIGEPEAWDQAIEALKRAIAVEGVPYEMDEGGGAFYGPKIDLKLKDVLGREWQTTTIQFDFNEPERFGMTYVGADGLEHRPYMVHRALLGSIERFFGVLLEHYGGAFPVWLAPVQAILIPIAERHTAYAKQAAEQLREAGLRVEVDESGDRMQAKIRAAQLQKVPYMLVVGDREAEAGKVAVRLRNGQDLGAQPVAEFCQMALEAAAAKRDL
ncbi:MAG TPA: threonine--tRNA ligase [Anaerolineae bacterium]|nr:threonine--tRNA ligase [Anaerolineae bacterium]